MSDDDIRARADERRRMLNELELERNQLIRNIETCRIRDIERPFLGDWSLKDIVGHVASWEAEYVSALRDVRAGRRPGTDELGDREESWNAEQVLLKRETRFWDVLQQLHMGRSALLESLAEFSDDELTDDAAEPSRLVRELIAHDRRHWHEIAAKLAGLAGVRPVSPEQNEAATTTSS
jgi:hypothetical protein